ncbi:hypothetical protein BDV25DRAFT_6697 [Aspergillus avenaceus]|uniref:Short-chain dehydrogenase/reductase 3 n=1 Tax=Aspergillus avenaceus TaxID=36643 RepID=A0A5N6TS17_ASPAV|nr:hypothetical protein BDV25DRAFT_6697 [Aspergillus avenaceus]
MDPKPAIVNFTWQAALMVFGTVLAVYALQRLSAVLSECVVNNWYSAGPWDPQKELVLVTGGCSGIGQKIAEDLSKNGIEVVILDIQKPRFELSSKIYFYSANVASAESIRTAAELIRKNHGHPTVLINNAGVFYNGTILDEPEYLIRRTFEVNTLAHFLTVKEFLPHMIQQNSGHIITMASVASFITVGEMVDYCCTKSSALAFHEGLTQEIRHWHKAPGVRTSIVHPIWVQTPLIENLTSAGKTFGQAALTPKMISSAVVEHVLAKKSGQLILPTNAVVLSFARLIPWWLQEWLRDRFSLVLKRVRDDVWSQADAQRSQK